MTDMLTMQQQLERAIADAQAGYAYLQSLSIVRRAALMECVADAIEALGDDLIATAQRETALPAARLIGEKARTVGQWRLYGRAVASGAYAEARIDRGDGQTKADIRKCTQGIGPVVVFGASNFPFAFSTAGGDTASAIAAGCSVIVKAHSSHRETSWMMAAAVQNGLRKYGAPASVFGCVSGSAAEVGLLITHPAVRAIGFTGSYAGGKAIFDLANQRPEPIPVFAEMSSCNPVFALPECLSARAESLAKQYAASLTLGVGQFCTNPGVVVGIRGDGWERFKQGLRAELSGVPAGKMLNERIRNAYENGVEQWATRDGVAAWAKGRPDPESGGRARAQVFTTTAERYLADPALLEEVFGPAGLLVECADETEMLRIAEQIPGQLTITFAATEDEMRANLPLFQTAKQKAGRLLFGGMPTGVEVVFAMQHGGPFPATTDARFTSVGPDAVKRFLRPVSYQNWPQSLLPEELRDGNPLKIPLIEN